MTMKLRNVPFSPPDMTEAEAAEVRDAMWKARRLCLLLRPTCRRCLVVLLSAAMLPMLLVHHVRKRWWKLLPTSRHSLSIPIMECG